MNAHPTKFFAAWLKTILIVFAIGLGSVPLVAEEAEDRFCDNQRRLMVFSLHT